MATLKTRPVEAQASTFLDSVPNPVRRADGKTLCAMMERVTGETATLWGSSIVGFGSYHYVYDSGHEGDMCRVGFSPRASALVLYLGGFSEFETLLEKLGKHRRSKSCLYVNRLSDVDMGVLEDITRRTFTLTAVAAS